MNVSPFSRGTFFFLLQKMKIIISPNPLCLRWRGSLCQSHDYPEWVLLIKPEKRKKKIEDLAGYTLLLPEKGWSVTDPADEIAVPIPWIQHKFEEWTTFPIYYFGENQVQYWASKWMSKSKKHQSGYCWSWRYRLMRYREILSGNALSILLLRFSIDISC